MITVWRLTKVKHLDDCFSGEGARASPARWSSGGRPIVYTADSPALALVEILVHLEDSAILSRYRLRSAKFDDSLVEDVAQNTLPHDWKTYPAPAALQSIGDEWLRAKRSVALRVPSVVAPGYNYLLNPEHADFRHVTIAPGHSAPLDPRLERFARKPSR